MSTQPKPPTVVHVQEARLDDILAAYVKGFQVPDGGVILRWDANVDMSTRLVWFRLMVENPAPDNNKIITIKG